MERLPIFLLALITIYALAPIPTVKACPGCNEAHVAVVDAPYYWDSDCGYRYPQNPTNAYPMGCGETKVIGFAVGQSCDWSTHGGTFDPQPWGSVSYAIESQNSTQIKYRVFVKPGEENKPGGFKLTATASGKDVFNNCADVTPKAIGFVDYQPGGGCGSGSCKSPNAFATPDVNTGSIDFTLHLGKTQLQEDAGIIWLNTEAPSSTLCQPSALQVPFNRSGVEVITNSSGVILQIKVPEGLVNVAVSNSYQ